MNLVNIVDPQNEKINSELCLGIDFGTTNSVCSIKKDNKIVFVEDFGKKLIPSIILFKKKILVGNQIQEIQKMSDMIFSIKRYFTKDPDKKNFLIGGDEKKSAIEVAKEIFSYIKNTSEKFLKKSIDNCVLTVPAYFDEKARSGLMRAAFMAGFNVKRLINEPTAAAFAYGLEGKKRGLFLVYDLGGGTFDVSILKLSDGVFKVIGSSGDSNLGGDDFDFLIASYILKNFKCTLEDLKEEERIRFIKKCKNFKERLFKENSFDESITVNGKTSLMTINLQLLNDSLNDLVDKTISIVTKLINECDISIKDIDGFILVGGSTRLKIIKKKIIDKFKKPIFDDLDPDLVVSRGAALHGFELLNGSKNLLLDVTPLSLGIETMGGLTEKIIPRNSPVPSIREQEFTTNENGQTSIKIKIVQGEREASDDNHNLGEFVLSGLEPKPAGIPRIKVRFSLDADGILFVSAFDESSLNENSLVIKTNNELSINEMRSIVESSIKHAQKDMDLRFLIESKVKATKLMNEISNAEKLMNKLCSKKEIKNINKIIILMKDEIKNSNNKEKIDKLTETLNESTKEFAEKILNQNFSSFVGKKINQLD
tara:strand:+ start:2465 stop:4252 length:1788 start_codon:yes stop_codon:yes gene_type:complete